MIGNDKRRMTLGSKYKWAPDNNPAVGQYDHITSFNKTQTTVKKAFINLSPKASKKTNDVPGPGYYDSMSK